MITLALALAWIAAEIAGARRRAYKTRTLAWKVTADALWLAWSIAFLGAGHHLGTYGTWTGYLWSGFAVLCLACGGAQLNDHLTAYQRARQIDRIAARCLAEMRQREERR